MNIFYSWQSDLDGKSNNYLIRDILEDLITKFNVQLVEPIRLEHDTKNLSGSPEIKSNIFQKIDKSEIFIADISIINQDYSKRKTPNPNVLTELGYSINKFGWSKILLLFNEHYGNELDLPFDIRGHRLIKYNISIGQQKNPNIVSNLKGRINQALKAILFDIQNEITPEKAKIEEISANMDFEEVNVGNENYRCLLKFNLFFVNKTSENLNNLKFQLYLNDQEIYDIGQTVDGVFNFRKPIQREYELPINDISDTLMFKIIYSTDEIPNHEKKFKLKINEEWETKGSERVFHMMKYIKMEG